MKRAQILAMAAAMVALTAFGAFPASAQTFLDGVDGTPPCGSGQVQIDGVCVNTVTPTTGVPIGVAAPASQEFSERRITSGAANPTTRISNTGDNVNLCTPVQQVVNTGNVANEQGVVLSGSEVDDVDFTGSNITIEPSETAECTQTIDQAATAV